MLKEDNRGDLKRGTTIYNYLTDICIGNFSDISTLFFI